MAFWLGGSKGRLGRRAWIGRPPMGMGLRRGRARRGRKGSETREKEKGASSYCSRASNHHWGPDGNVRMPPGRLCLPQSKRSQQRSVDRHHLQLRGRRGRRAKVCEFHVVLDREGNSKQATEKNRYDAGARARMFSCFLHVLRCPLSSKDYAQA